MLVTIKGGRQRCPLEALIFNLSYSRALYSVGEDLNKSNITLKLKAGWYHERIGKARVNISEATDVDDQLYCLVARSPLDLDRSIETTLCSVTKHFGRNAFNINWKKGKTEASWFIWVHMQPNIRRRDCTKVH